MSHTAIMLIAMAVVLVGGAAVALVWWSLADKFFPGAARSTGQGLRRRRDAKPTDGPVVVRGFDGEGGRPPTDGAGTRP